MTTRTRRTDHGIQAAGIAPVIVLLAVLTYMFRSSLWVALPVAGLGLTVPEFAACVWRWRRTR